MLKCSRETGMWYSLFLAFLFSISVIIMTVGRNHTFQGSVEAVMGWGKDLFVGAYSMLVHGNQGWAIMLPYMNISNLFYLILRAVAQETSVFAHPLWQ